MGEFSLSRTADAEGAEAIVTSDFTSHFRLHASYFIVCYLSRTEHAEGAEAVVTSYFRLHASYFVQRHSMQGAGTRSVESPWLTHDGFSLARTADAEGAEAIVTSDFTSYFRLHAAYFTLPYDRTRLPRWLV